MTENKKMLSTPIKHGFLTSLELFANGKSVGKIIRKVDTMNPDYILREQGAVLNWFAGLFLTLAKNNPAQKIHLPKRNLLKRQNT